MYRCIVFILILFASQVRADYGYTYSGDLNGDGIADRIMSGPSAMFGNSGGPFIIYLSKADGTYINKVVAFHPKAIAFEKYESGRNSLWGYWRHGTRQGTLFKLSLDGEFKVESITINPIGSNLSSGIYSTVFDKNSLLKIKRVEGYMPPDYPWGKG
ncbi:hypothetical protein [Microbulbifer sp. JMSA008]|uniref:hypothetical protein n=1 Tax=Microbulbifer sp. JMSA008 TaxID=3243373 RepID=UPI004039B632